MPRPFLFGVSLIGPAPAGKWRAKWLQGAHQEDRRLQRLLKGQVRPAVQQVTERPRLGTALTGGRLALGLGTVIPLLRGAQAHPETRGTGTADMW